MIFPEICRFEIPCSSEKSSSTTSPQGCSSFFPERLLVRLNSARGKVFRHVWGSGENTAATAQGMPTFHGISNRRFSGMFAPPSTGGGSAEAMIEWHQSRKRKAPAVVSWRRIVKRPSLAATSGPCLLRWRLHLSIGRRCRGWAQNSASAWVRNGGCGCSGRMPQR